MAAFSSDSEDYSYQPGDTFKKQTKEKSIEKADTAEKADKEQKKGKKDSKAKAAKEWNDDELTLLIDMLESKPCLWDIYHPDYLKRDMKEIGYSEIATALNTTNASVKTKINGLRAQLGREITKEKTTKSGQSTDELYKSNWVHYDKLSFLIPVIGAGKSRDTLKRNSLPEDATEKEGETTPVPKKKSIAEKKLELLSKCTDAITSKAAVSSEPPAQKISNFAMYVDEKLSNLDKRSRRIAEKRISDVLFEAEMSLDLTEAGEQRNTFGYNCQSLQQPFAFTAHQTQPRDLFTPKSHQRTGDQVAFNINPHGQASFNHAQPEQGGQTYMEMINNN